MKKKLALSLAGIITLSMIPTLPTYATSEYISAAELIEDAITVTLTNITSPTLNDAVTDTIAKITVENNIVHYDGSAIGYWYADDSDNIYANDEKTATIISPVTDNQWKIDPDFLEIILPDINEGLIETITPNLNDWSKVIDKYDVTLGGMTFTADQFYPVTIDSSINDALANKNYVDVYKAQNKILTDYKNKTNYIGALSYIVDEDGQLYIQNQVISFHTAYNTSNVEGTAVEMNGTGIKLWWNNNVSSFDTLAYGVCQYIKFALIKDENGALICYPLLTDITGTNYIYASLDNTAFAGKYQYFNVNDITTQYTGDYSNVKAGFILFDDYTNNINAAQLSTIISQTPDANKTITGNSSLTRNITKLASLDSNDMIVVSENGWLINGTTPMNEYMGEQKLTTAGQTTEMNGSVEIEELNFCVIVPTTLPMQADRSGAVTTATNAKIINESNAPIKITDLTINANSAIGWTRIEGTPDKTRGANEFSFDVSLNVGDTLDTKTDLPFTYEADMSPAEDDVTSVDLVTIMIAFDWAE